MLPIVLIAASLAADLESRVWISTTGSYFEGEVISRDDKSIAIQANNGDVKICPLAKLCGWDRKMLDLDKEPEGLQRLYAKADKSRSELYSTSTFTIRELKEKIAATKAAKVSRIRPRSTGVPWFPTIQKRAEAVAIAESKLATIESNMETWRESPTLRFDLSPTNSFDSTGAFTVGDAGYLVLPPNVIKGSRTSFEVVQVIDDDEMLILCLGRETYISGFSTDGIADGQDWTPTEPLYVVGTKTYKTVVGGSNTVYELKAIELPK